MEPLLTILLAVTTITFAYISYFINKLINKVIAETEKIKMDKDRDFFVSALEELQRLINKTVTSTSETIAKELKVRIADGQIDKEELYSLAPMTVDKVLEQIKPEYKTVLEKNITDLQDHVLDMIETKVMELK